MQPKKWKCSSKININTFLDAWTALLGCVSLLRVIIRYRLSSLSNISSFNSDSGSSKSHFPMLTKSWHEQESIFDKQQQLNKQIYVFGKEQAREFYLYSYPELLIPKLTLWRRLVTQEPEMFMFEVNWIYSSKMTRQNNNINNVSIWKKWWSYVQAPIMWW